MTWQEFMSLNENKNLTLTQARRKYLLENQQDFKNELLTNFMYGTLGHHETKFNNYSLTFSGNTTGDSTYVETAFDPYTHGLQNGFTISYWLRLDENVSVAFALGLKSSNSERFEFGLNSASGGTGFWGVGNTKHRGTEHGMSVGTWYHWVITFTGGSGGTATMYRDGSSIGTFTTNWTVTTGNETLYFGGRNVNIGSESPYDNGLSCGLDEVAIFDEIKDPTYLSDASGNPIDLSRESGLVGYWRFEEGRGTTVKDLSGNGKHGTLTTDDTGLPTWSIDIPK